MKSIADNSDISNSFVLVTIEWKEREDRFKPLNSNISNKIIRNKCPELLVDFYETRINSSARF